MIEFLLRCLNLLRQFETGELGTVLPQCDSRQEENANLWLPSHDLIAPEEVLFSRRAEFEQHAIRKGPRLLKILVDALTNRIAAVDRDSYVLRKRFVGKLSQQLQCRNERSPHL